MAGSTNDVPRRRVVTPYGYPESYYHVLLDEQPYYLVPPRLYGAEEPEQLIVSPHCWFSWLGEPPPDLAARLHMPERFLPWPCIVWVDDAATRSVWPYWLGHEYVRYFEGAAPGRPLPSAIPAHVEWVLKRARILVGQNAPARSRRAWMTQALARVPQFRRGYVGLDGLVPPFHIGAMRRYYRAHLRAGTFKFGDDQVSRRHIAHNEPVASYVHHQLTTLVGDLAETEIKPSYSYLAAYHSGSVLERHTDRPQCEYSVTLCIDATPEPQAQSAWPIDLDTTDGRLRVWQHIGDGLLYRGRYIPHSRERLPEGYSSTSLLLHYVDQSFDGPLN
jgi:hypothetical protein